MSKRRKYIPDLVADMAECDANYMRLHRLFPDMASEEGVTFGIMGKMDSGALVTIRIIERCPYTTKLSVKVDSDEGKPFIRWPSLTLRVYHDVKSAEVVEFERHRNFLNRHQFMPDEKSQINRFLGELLSFCLAQGHSLAEVELSS